MTKCCFILLMLFPLMNHASGQTIFHPFELKGTINIDTGTAILMPVNDSSYYPANLRNIGSKISNGKFLIKDSIACPYGFWLLVKEGGRGIYISGMFIVDTGIQSVFCNVHELREIPQIANHSMKELAAYNKWLNTLRNEFSINHSAYDSLYHFYQNKIPDNLLLNNINPSDSLNLEADILFLTTIKENPNSYVSLWELVERLLKGYNPFTDSAYQYLSSNIKNTYTGRAVARRLAASRVVSYGRIFLRLKLLNTDNHPVVMHIIKPGSRFTLIDFWFSHCPPCIGQFNEFKKLYSAYHSKGFNIIGISTDKKENAEDWKKIIKKYELPWPQYLDPNAKKAEMFSIELYPSNFLVNNEGKIIARNIQPNQLKYFLRQWLN